MKSIYFFSSPFFSSLATLALIAPASAFADTHTATPSGPTHTPMVISDDSARGRYEGVKADNSAVNRNDDRAGALTPLDQSNNPDEIRVTARVRKALMDRPELSTEAKNIKIITTDDGKITLRGVVESESERQQVVALASRNSSGLSVRNELSTRK